jgi:hypothetical protein
MLLFVGSLQPGKRGAFANSTAYVLFVPVERKFPMIRVQTRQVSAHRHLLLRWCLCSTCSVSAHHLQHGYVTSGKSNICFWA